MTRIAFALVALIALSSFTCTAGQRPMRIHTPSSVMKSSKQYRIMKKLVKETKLDERLKNGKDITVFLPNNAAFNGTMQSLGYTGPFSEFHIVSTIRRLSAINVISISELLSYHILPQSLNFSQLAALKTVPTLNKSLTIEVRKGANDAYSIVDKASPSLPDATAVKPFDVKVTDGGFVHTIDRVLLPFEPNLDDLKVQFAKLKNNETSDEDPTPDDRCFPASARVHVASGASVAMADLTAGVSVRISEKEGHFSPVFLFSHRTRSGLRTFVRIAAASGHALSLSPSHYVYANGRLVAARAVKVGDVLRTLSGPSPVISVSRVKDFGLVAPHAVHSSDIVVDGIVASAYTTAVHPRVADVLLAPVRAVVRLGLATEPLGSVLYDGADRTAHMLPSGPPVY